MIGGMKARHTKTILLTGNNSTHLDRMIHHVKHKAAFSTVLDYQLLIFKHINDPAAGHKTLPIGLIAVPVIWVC